VLSRGSVAYSLPPAFADDRHVLLLGQEGPNPDAVAVTEVGTGQVMRTIRLADAGGGGQAAFAEHFGITPDRRTVVALASVYPKTGDSRNVAARWDAATGKYLGRVNLPDGAAYDPLSPDAGTVISGTVLTDVYTGKRRKLALDGNTGWNFNATVSVDGRLAAIVGIRHDTDGSRPAGAFEFDAATGRSVDRLPDVPGARLLFTPDGRRLVAADTAGIAVWDLATRQRVLWLPAHSAAPGDFGPSFVSCWDISPDGRTLATGHPDGTILLWDLSKATATREPAAPLAAAELARLWDRLAGDDPAAAYTAGWELTDRPAQGVELLRGKLTPAAGADVTAVRKLVAGLDAAAFADRETAEAGLRKLGAAAGAALRAVLTAGGLSAEQRDRITHVLTAIPPPGPPTAAELPAARAIAVLERVATANARELLTRLAAGAADARLTGDARAALDRLRQRGVR
jgi:hypothetical protein